MWEASVSASLAANWSAMVTSYSKQCPSTVSEMLSESGFSQELFESLSDI